MTNKWCVYIIATESGKLYTGITNNLERRYSEHLTQRKGARFFRISKPEKIIFHEYYPNRSEASKREIEIKKMRQQEKWELAKNRIE